jgi:uncharacterized membrane protein YjjP (DUF1212 family)
VAESRVSLSGGLSLDELADYLIEVGATLSAYGNPTHRTESVVRLIAEGELCECEVFAVPTGLWLSVKDPSSASPAVRMARVKEWRVNLDRLAAVDQVFNDVIDRKLSFAEARLAIDDLELRPPPYPRPLFWLSHAGACASTAVFFRGGMIEVLIAALSGALLVLASRVLRTREGASLLAEFTGGVLAASLAWIATTLYPSTSREVVVLSAVILLVPGMALTTGLAELVNRNLVSGAGRLMEAFAVALSIVFGIACVVALETAVGGARMSTPVTRLEPPLSLQLAALIVAALCFCVLFHVPRRHLLGALMSAAIGWVVTGQATRHLPGSLAAFAAALSVTLWANGCARVTQRPAQVFLLPGLVLLVPGSFGFLSLEAFLRGEVLGGAAKGFEMFLVAGAIVTGLLLANVLLPARKAL